MALVPDLTNITVNGTSLVWVVIEGSRFSGTALEFL